VAAGLLARAGRKVLLLEAHDKPGGTAGWYEADGFTFDAGATTLIGFDPGDPLHALAEALRIPLGPGGLELEPVEGVEVIAGGERFFFGREQNLWRDEVRRVFPAGAEDFFERVRGDGKRLWHVAKSWPRLPLTSPSDLLRNLRVLRSPSSLLSLLCTFDRTVADVERLSGAPSAHPAFRAFVDLSLLITVQSGPDVAPWWNGALGLDLFRRGVSRARGGMKAFAGAFAGAASAAGAEIRLRTPVTQLRREGSRWTLRTAGGEDVRARQVVANLPVADLPLLLAGEETARASRAVRGKEEGWGAVVLNLGLSRPVNPHPRRLHRLVAPDSLFLSFSPPGDPAAPPGGQTLSVSTHTDAGNWASLRGEDYRTKKEEVRARMRTALADLYPDLDAAVVHEDIGTPRTFRRFTRRGGGRVGGLPITRRNSGFFAVDPTLGLPDFQLVGDTTFPGQGTLAAAVSGALASERLGAVRLLRGSGVGFRRWGTAETR
jgi:phytoene dehydrogenase-like protein